MCVAVCGGISNRKYDITCDAGDLPVLHETPSHEPFLSMGRSIGNLALLCESAWVCNPRVA
jgi:hypothetical protein